MLTDGGVFYNLGTTCLLPGRDAPYSTNVFDGLLIEAYCPQL